MFVHLHTHSYYSLLQGLNSPRQLAETAAEQNMPALALTDFRMLSGAIEFYDSCTALGIRPILGLDVPLELPDGLKVSGDNRVVLLAQDRSGWSNLCRLSSLLNTENTKASYADLYAYRSGLICLCGGYRSLFRLCLLEGDIITARQYLMGISEIYPDHRYVSLQIHSEEDKLWVEQAYDLAHLAQIPVVATHNVYYLEATQQDLQGVVTAIRENQSIQDVPDEEFAPPNACFPDMEQMERQFKHYPQAF